ncbi:MAG: DUF742 domain-containing protein [Mycobacteriaceae bacterium]|nr:DUF742 domain-containing protein [Mycobacteriaceae bacterium]
MRKDRDRGSTGRSRKTSVDDIDSVLVRPFMVSAGRTIPLVDGLRYETMVQATPAALSAPLHYEHRQAAQLCQRAQSVAEIAAALLVPIGVAKVIVGDLVSAGHAAVREPAGEVQIDVLERIRDLVRQL